MPIAFSDKNELTGKYLNTTRGNFLRTLDISCFSFTDVCRRAVPLMNSGGSLLTLTYADRVLGQERADGEIPEYDAGQFPAHARYLVLLVHRCVPPRRAADEFGRQ